MTTEQTLIAIALQYPQTLSHIVSHVRIDEITNPICRKVYRQAVSQYDKSKDVHLQNMILDEVVLLEVIDWMDATPSAAGYKAIADAVIENGRKEKLKKVLLESLDKLEEGEEVREVVDALFSKQKDFGRTVEPPAQLHAVLTDMRNNPTMEIYQTFLVALDSMLEILPTQLGIIAARPGVGKSSMARMIAFYFATKRRVLFNSSEMSKEEVSSALGGLILTTDSRRVQRKELTDNEYATVLNVAKNVRFDLSEYSNTRDIENAIISARNAGNEYSACIVDYLQLLKGNDKTGNRTEEVSGITRDLKEIALHEKQTVIALSQLNRCAANERPQLHHLRESGSIEQDANWVLFIDDEPDQPTLKRLILAKNRGGSIGECLVRWHPEWTGFSDIGDA